MPVHELDNETSVPFLGADQVWEDTGYTGEGIKVAIIDTGIDYTHASFGGPGTVEAFEQAAASSTSEPDPALGWGARVKGGWDFVGDDYRGTNPQPDPNPLDCQGHGSHVAGTAGGSGVLPDGSTYDGPWDSGTYDTDFEIGPGVAPEIDLYALRVFGCDGSTNATTEAIDWAVANDMDVINMSLGSPYGTKGDPSAVASSNAVAAGVVVIASAGNSGPAPYITGSPGSGEGVVSVAAIDGTETYPGAQLTFDGTTIEAINANGAEIPEQPLEIVVLRDEDGSVGLGCELEEYEAAGIVPGGNQLAVTQRGSCARVARAGFGQQAGAAAVVMINSDANFPPYEGEIVADPSLPVFVDVTIPFLGVRGVLGAEPTDDGDALAAADGEQVDLTAARVDNPGFRQFASFSSDGPRSVDSGLKPDVAAPGVSTFSTEVGSGWRGSFKSGTSMAAPHVAGVAALGVQAHPDWSADEISSSLVATADDDGLSGYQLTRGGAGLVDTAQVVNGSVVAFGDEIETEDGLVRQPTLSFGLAEGSTTFTERREVTLVNKGSSAQTYAVAATAGPESQPADVRVSPSSVTVPAGGSATVRVTLQADADALPSILSGAGQHRFYEVSGNIEFTGGDGDLTVPYLLVPRPSADGTVAPKKINSKANNGTKLNVFNRGGGAAVETSADVFAWGIEDAQDQAADPLGTGFDVRAAGAQSFTLPDGDTLLVFAVNMYDHYSNAASNEYSVFLDVDQDGAADMRLFSYDSGAVRSGSVNGTAEVFLRDLRTGGLFGTGFLTTAPTDNSTVMLPVRASQVAVTGAFDYEVYAFVRGNGVDFTDTATYDPTTPVLSTTGQYAELQPGDKVSWRAQVDTEAWEDQGTLGQMVVFYDNPAGEEEAQLIPLK